MSHGISFGFTLASQHRVSKAQISFASVVFENTFIPIKIYFWWGSKSDSAPMTLKAFPHPPPLLMKMRSVFLDVDGGKKICIPIKWISDVFLSVAVPPFPHDTQALPFSTATDKDKISRQ